MAPKIDNYINHILFVLDKSGSMAHLREDVIRVFDAQVAHLAKRSQEMDQETRVTVFLFDYPTNLECIIYDKDVLRLPSLRGYYDPHGSTALIDATIQAITDLRLTPEKYGDHAFLAYVITDGEENASRNRPEVLKKLFAGLPDNWTVAAMVPDQAGVHEAKRFGFPADNVSIWDTTSKAGLEEAVKRIRNTSDRFMELRRTGVRRVHNLFTLDLSSVSKTAVQHNLEQLKPGTYTVYSVDSTGSIKDVVRVLTGEAYQIGTVYYQLTKSETVQEYKQFCVRDKSTKRVYTGAAARQVLGIPEGRFKLTPVMLGAFDIFIQSTSVNRKLLAGTDVLVMK